MGSMPGGSPTPGIPRDGLSIPDVPPDINVPAVSSVLSPRGGVKIEVGCRDTMASRANAPDMPRNKAQVWASMPGQAGVCTSKSGTLGGRRTARNA